VDADDQGHHRQPAEPSAVTQQAQVQERRRVAFLDPEEGYEQDCRRKEAPQRAGCDPSTIRSADEPVDQRYRTNCRSERPGHVETGGLRMGFCHEAADRDHHEYADRHVDEQRPAP
jgi:hypothetical protein